MKRELIGKIECYYKNHGYGSYISFNNYPDFVNVFINDNNLRKKFYKEITFDIYNEGDHFQVLSHGNSGILTWLKKWMKENHVYFARTDYEKYTSTSISLKSDEYEFQ